MRSGSWLGFRVRVRVQDQGSTQAYLRHTSGTLANGADLSSTAVMVMVRVRSLDLS